jgi:hypothetical protein
MAKQRKRPPRSRLSSPHPLFPDPGAVYQRARHQYQDLMAWMASAVEPWPKKARRGRPPALSLEEYVAHRTRHPDPDPPKRPLSDAQRARSLSRELTRAVSRHQVWRRRQEYEREVDR